MKKIIILVIFASLLIVGCGKLDKAKKAIDTVKQVAEIAEDTAESFKDMDEEEIKKIKLKEKEVISFFKNITKIKDKYPDIHFQVAQVAFLEAIGVGKDLKDIVNKEMSMSFEEYTRLSTVITFAEATGVGLQLSEAMYEQMLLGKETLESRLKAFPSAEEKEELEKALAEAEQEIEKFEEEMNKDEFANIKHNYDLILKIKEEMDI